MNKLVIIGISTFLLLISVLFFTLRTMGLAIREKNEEIKELVGKQVIIQKDTLVVIDYSLLDNTYTLSNGIDYDIDFVKTRINE